MLHIGPGTRTQPKAFRNNGRERAPDLHGGGENLRFCDYIMLSFAPQVWLTAMVYDGVCLRRTRSRRRAAPGPSEYLRRAVKFTPFPGEDVGRMIRDGGADLFLFSTDYPHPEGTNDPLGRFERTLADLDDEALDRFYRRNFEEMMQVA